MSNHLGAIVLSGACLLAVALLASDPAVGQDEQTEADGPIHVIDLLWFQPGVTMEDAGRYMKQAVPLIAKHGGERLMGFKIDSTIKGDIKPDLIGGFTFPSQAALQELFSDPEYQAIVPLRDATFDMTRHVLFKATPMQAPPAGDAQSRQSSPDLKLPRPEISEDFPFQGKYVSVEGSKMFYIDEGAGDPVVFIHGNPTSSYLWRNVIPYVSSNSRAIALGLIGMGRSDKPDIEYRYVDHYRYLEGFIEALDLKNITFVVHDWGATLGFDYARLHPDRVKAVAFMEGVLPPTFPQPSYEAMGEEMGGMFRAMRDPVKGRELVIDNHMFVEQVLPGFVNRKLGDKAMAEYRRPYTDPATRKPILAWPCEVPIAGEPADVTQRLRAVGAFMGETDMPLLLLYADPGVVVPPQAVPWYTEHVRNLEAVYIGQGMHFIQEDQPDAIGRALSDWIRRHGNQEVRP